MGHKCESWFQKSFIDEVKKAISNHHGSNKQYTEGAAVTCVRLCKASSYIPISDRLNVVFTLVQSVINDLKVSTNMGDWFFKYLKSFRWSRNSANGDKNFFGNT